MQLLSAGEYKFWSFWCLLLVLLAQNDFIASVCNCSVLVQWPSPKLPLTQYSNVNQQHTVSFSHTNSFSFWGCHTIDDMPCNPYRDIDVGLLCEPAASTAALPGPRHRSVSPRTTINIIGLAQLHCTMLQRIRQRECDSFKLEFSTRKPAA